ncbi:uncharacterized protein LOC110673139 [Hevea brasiliensis]|uniref:uncharacterized protein LOC110673139 n=1 Tax=Hevea brasiliensis TaxID=3981 RepID=UPI0025E38826|nr:uncharacterized protein LOC110673139 [Hevea brasiliensis]
MPSYAKFLKDILSKKRKLEDHETVMLTEECSAIIQNKLPSKLKDPKSFIIPCNIGNVEFTGALCDLGACINLMPPSVLRKLRLRDIKPTMDFVVLNKEEDREVPLILRSPFLVIGKALIDVHESKLTLRVGKEEVTFNVLHFTKHPMENDECFRMDIIDECVHEMIDAVKINDKIACVEEDLCLDVIQDVECDCVHDIGCEIVHNIEIGQEKVKENSVPKLELKPLSSHPRYAFLGESSTFPMIILQI